MKNKTIFSSHPQDAWTPIWLKAYLQASLMLKRIFSYSWLWLAVLKLSTLKLISMLQFPSWARFDVSYIIQSTMF